jgi:hypothetical protein
VTFIQLSLRILVIWVFAIALAAFGAWGALALYYRAGDWEAGRLLLAVGFALVIVATLRSFLSRNWKQSGPGLLLCPLVLVWWGGIAPSNQRDWAEDVSRVPFVHINGTQAVVDNVRDFRWTSATEAEPVWNSRSYDLDTLESVDLFASYWDGENIAHTFVSFGFADGSHLAWSAELRRSVGQKYETLKSLFKLSELILIAGDERDLVGVRAKARGEDVRLYRLNVSRDVARRLFTLYAQEANALAAQPRWYNTLTNNCTTTIFDLATMLDPSAHYDWRILLPGHFPKYAYDNGALDRSEPFSTLEKRSSVSSSVRAADASSSIDFSKAIRVGR